MSAPREPEIHVPGLFPFIVITALFEGSLAVFAVAVGWAVNIPPVQFLRFEWQDVGRCALATLPPLVVFGACAFIPLAPFRRILHLLETQFLPLIRNATCFELALVAFVTGLGEEMLFRVTVQHGIGVWAGGAYGPMIGLAVAAVSFGLLHGVTLTYSILATVLGVYFGCVWRYCDDNLVVPIAAHALYDFIALVYLLKIRKTNRADAVVTS